MKRIFSRRTIFGFLALFPCLFILSACGDKESEGNKAVMEGKFNPFASEGQNASPKK